MKRAVHLLPLLALAPLGHFLGAYLEGAGILPSCSGFLIGTVSVLFLPWAVAAVFFTVKVMWPIRLFLFLTALAMQGILLFTVVPAGATSEMMGIAYRLRRDFQPDMVRTCAAALRQKERDGTLLVKQGEREPGYFMSEKAVLVDDTELPVPLRGRFTGVFIQPDPDSGEQRVYFSLDGRTGIVCDSRKDVRDFFVCSMAEGVHAYRYQRP